MALDIVQYKSGDPITAGTTYQIPGEINSDAWILQSTTQGAVFQMTGTAPTDEDWSNIQGDQFHINGTVTGIVLPILAYGYFRVVKEPVTEHATMALVEQEFVMEIADSIDPFVAGTPVAPGYYDLSSLNLEAGKMYVLSVLPEQDKDYPETPNIVTDETFSAVIVGLTGTKATQVILRGVTTVGSHLFVMTGAKPILHLGGRSNVKFNITVSPVVFSAGGGSFDPSQPATITGLWDLQNVSGINLVDEGPLILGKGDNAVKIHGSGTGSAVIEGANGATLDIAVPVDFSEPVIFQDTVSYNRVGTTGEPIFQRWVMPRATLTLKGFEGAGTFGFANADGSQNYIGIDATGNVSFLKNTNHSGASTFSAGVTMGQTLTVAGNTTINGIITTVKTLCLNSSSGVSSIYLSGAYTSAGEIYTLSFDDGDGSPFMSWAYNRLAKRIDVSPISEVSLSLPVLQSLSVEGAVLVNSLQLGPNDIKYDATKVTATGDWNLGRTTFTGATTFNAGATFAQAITVAGVLMATGGVTIPNKNLYLGPNIRFVAESGNALELKMDSADGSFTVPSLAVAAPTSTTSGALSVGGPATFAQTLSVTGNTTLNGNILMGPVTISRSANMLTFSSPVTFQGAMTFNAGVTMAQTLTVAGAANFNGGMVLADGQGIQFGTSISQYSTGSDFWLEGPAGGKVGLNIPIEFPGPAEGTTLTDNMGVNVAMGDARYAKVVTTTKAAYTALATKDPTTIYLITDTTPRMWAIGDMEIVTADVPA